MISLQSSFTKKQLIKSFKKVLLGKRKGIIAWTGLKLQYPSRGVDEERKKGIDQAQNNVALGFQCPL
jgi:hypothetical protein